MDKIISVEVDHCTQSHACLLYKKYQQDEQKPEFMDRLGLGDTLQLLYSGDTMQCQNFTNYASTGCTLLIHEATFTDDFKEKALVSKHTTTGQALNLVR